MLVYVSLQYFQNTVFLIFQGAYADFVGERNVTVDGVFEARNEVDGTSDVGAGNYEEKCLSEGIMNAYKAYEIGTYQVRSLFFLSLA